MIKEANIVPIVLEENEGLLHWRLKGQNEPLCEWHQSIIMLARTGRDVEDGIPTCLWCALWKSRRPST